jgi:hypothetical protein
MANTKRHAAALKAADTRRRNRRREITQVAGKRREFILTYRRIRRGVVTTVRLAHGWRAVRTRP